MKNIGDFVSENFQFLEVKFSIYLNRCVFVMRNINVHLLYVLAGSMLGKIFSRRHFDVFSFPQNIGFLTFNVACLLMKCQRLFSGENKKNIINLSSVELAQRVVKIKSMRSL